MRRNTFSFMFGVVCLTLLSAVRADEFCVGPQFSMAKQSPAQLREIAAQCASPSVADLYYNRAQYAELIRDNGVLQGMLVINSVDDFEWHADSYRMYMVMVELMAEEMIQDKVERVAFLNRQYTRLNHLFELRMKGFDRIADRLERDVSVR